MRTCRLLIVVLALALAAGFDTACRRDAAPASLPPLPPPPVRFRVRPRRQPVAPGHLYVSAAPAAAVSHASTALSSSRFTVWPICG